MFANNTLPSHRSRKTPALIAALASTFSLVAATGVACHADPTALPGSPNGVTVSVDSATGAYTVSEANPAWAFSGTTGAPLTNTATKDGTDALGAYTELTFDWTGPDGPRTGAIRRYTAKPVVLFSETARAAATSWNNAFPSFTSFPSGLHPFSYANRVFSPPTFTLGWNGTPWLLFNDKSESVVLAPVTNLFLARMNGNLQSTLTSGLNTEITNLPAGFTQSTMLYFGQNGIRDTFHKWGQAYTDLAGRKRPASDADLLLKYFGYWTDNGADYYYNYDMSKGYAGTLVALAKSYREEHIPIRYMQLDSWWFEKTRTSPAGKEGGPKNAKLPEGSWNAYGGTTLYRASPYLFPDGLAAFHKAVDMPLAVHARWIDPASPYHKDYKISGIAPVDPKWWDETAAYLKESGVICYEQDWLNEIYNHSPEMGKTPGVGNAFADNMSRSAAANGENLQYCMALPRYFLNGVRYDNLTTIRVSDDRFERARWNNFLYTSAYADALGIWPWVDVFKSHEIDNMLLATLSAGPVGTGDAIGKEVKANILQSVRADGRIVKPDAPITPADETFIADAHAAEAKTERPPMVAWTYSDHADGPRTAYVFATARRGDGMNTSVPLASLGLKSSQAFVYDYFSKTGTVVSTNSPKPVTLTPTPGYAYYVVAPVGPSKIALVGDSNLFVGTGRQHIPTLTETATGLTVTVALSPDEKSVTLTGWAPSAPTVKTTEGQAGKVAYDSNTQLFTVTVEPGRKPKTSTLDGDPVHFVTLTLTVK